MSTKFFRIEPDCQQYDWGKIGSSSAVAQFASHSNPNLKISESEPYAELWMGTHPKAPARHHQSKELLSDLIAKDPEGMLGKDIIARYNSKNELPFLFKVLSINKVLSLQAHPDKALGKVLRAKDPEHYPDDNHKPEMAIAVTDFMGFCGFKPLNEICVDLQRVPELRTLAGEEAAESLIKAVSSGAEQAEQKKLLQTIFKNIMETPHSVLSVQSRALIERATNHPGDFSDPELPALLIKLNEQFPEDVGLFSGAMLLNCCRLKPGEALFLKAKEPHAYISGDCMECMAASDNVVRAGFTPKFKDVDVLVDMLTYESGPADEQKMKLEKFPRASGDGESTLYNPPIDEFSVLETSFKNSIGTRHFEGFNGPSILITTKGKGTICADGVELQAEPGYVYFIAPKVPVDMKTDDNDFTTYRAFAEI